MQEQKIASVKLVSGEEIICNLLELEKDGNYTILYFEDPVVIKYQDRRKNRKYSLEPWLCVGNGSLHYIDVSKVITVNQVEDKEILRDYHTFFKSKLELKPRPTKKIKPANKIGYVGNTEEYKSVLEKIYKEVEAYEKPTEDI